MGDLKAESRWPHHRDGLLSCLNRCVPGLTALYVSSTIAKTAGNTSFNADANLVGASLHDVIHSRVPEEWDHTDPSSIFYQAPDRLLLGSVIVTFLMIAKKAPTLHAWAGMVGETTFLLAILFALRSSIIVMTTIPTPVRSCLGAKSLEDAQSGFAAAETYCNDLMFSGHTSFHIVLGSLWMASPTQTLSKVVMVCYILGSVFISVAVKDHYTMDVLVSAYVCIPICLLRRQTLLAMFHDLKDDLDDTRVKRRVVVRSSSSSSTKLVKNV